VGSSFYVSADREAGSQWQFTAEDVGRVVLAHWPDADLGHRQDGTVDLLVRVGDSQCELSFDPEYGVFSFADRVPWAAPLTVIYAVLHELVSGTPAVWWADFDATMEPLDVSVDLAGFISSFGS
jgi:hypothetical protein